MHLQRTMDVGSQRCEELDRRLLEFPSPVRSQHRHHEPGARLRRHVDGKNVLAQAMVASVVGIRYIGFSEPDCGTTACPVETNPRVNALRDFERQCPRIPGAEVAAVGDGRFRVQPIRGLHAAFRCFQHRGRADTQNARRPLPNRPRNAGQAAESMPAAYTLSTNAKMSVTHAP